MKKILFLLLFLFVVISAPKTFAAGNAFVSIVNPIRGNDFWDLKNQTVETAVTGQMAILDKSGLPATWLIRFDALGDTIITDKLKTRGSDEKGLFLEITPIWASQAKIQYHQSTTWHSAGSAFLTGYERPERERLIDTAFEKFKSIFGNYPSSVGAWWIDSYSLGYMQSKYGIISALIVADQYSTDNYQIWGQYFGTPYYPSKNNALHPAQAMANKLDIVMMQWAPRDPVNGYGNGVLESTFSVQANDYMDYHNLDTGYFSSLVDTYTKQELNQVNSLVVGLENSYDWSKYSEEYGRQIKTLEDKKKLNQFSVVTMRDFASWYQKSFKDLSPSQIIVSDDPLGSFKKSVWFMNPYYRAGWFLNSDGSVFRDIRQYIDGEEELCFKSRCDSVNFATSATRVLDEVSFGHKWILDKGGVTNFKVEKNNNEYVIDYRNEAKNHRVISFLPRDISIDGKISSIDATILNAVKDEVITPKATGFISGGLKWSPLSVSLKILEFLAFLVFVIMIPGLVFSNNLSKKDTPIILRLFLAAIVGAVILSVLFYLTSLLRVRFLIFVYILLNFIIFIRFKYFILLGNICSDLRSSLKQKLNLALIAMITAGIVFQVIPTFQSGLNFNYGIGLWGPNTHDGVWHLALINQLVKSVPVENPIYSGAILKNYHFFYDLLVAVTNYLIRIPVVDLVFRFYPAMFSMMVGIGSYYLIVKLFEGKLSRTKVKVSAFFGLYVIYFAGSFGWIVEFLRERHLGGESAFWANQAISLNLNPPFAVSLIILIALIHLLFYSNIKGIIAKIIAIIMIGTLSSFKSYTGILVLGSLSVVAITEIFRSKNFQYLWIFIFSGILTVLLFLINFQANTALIVFAPFWFIHAMIDSPDRVGWVRLSLARTGSLALQQWPKFFLVETISFFIFIIGNLGLRFLGLGLIVRSKEVFKSNGLMFISTVGILSVGIPVLFIQSGNPWNTIQFFYLALYITALFSGAVICFFIFKFKNIMAFLGVGLVLIMIPINSITTASGYITNTPHGFISVKELEGLRFLSQQADGVVLTHTYDEKLRQKLPEPWPLFIYGSTAYVSAFSKKAVFLEDEPQNQILLTDYKKKLVASNDFFLKPLAQNIKLLKENNIEYIYLQKIYNVKLDESSMVVKNIFENDEIVIYKVEI